MPEPVVPDTRFTLALERTLLAWIRTALALMGLGFVVARLPLLVGDLNSIGDPTSTTPALSRAIGVGLVCLAVLVQIIALYEYQRNSAKVMRGETLIPTLWSAVGILGMVLAAAGLALAAHLMGR
jgi:putative membrane protein